MIIINQEVGFMIKKINNEKKIISIISNKNKYYKTN